MVEAANRNPTFCRHKLPPESLVSGSCSLSQLLKPKPDSLRPEASRLLPLCATLFDRETRRDRARKPICIYICIYVVAYVGECVYISIYIYMCVCVCLYASCTCLQTDRQTDRQRKTRDGETQRGTERQREIERGKNGEISSNSFYNLNPNQQLHPDAETINPES